MPVELVKGLTRGIVDLKRVHCTSVQGFQTPVELVKGLTKGIESPLYMYLPVS